MQIGTYLPQIARHVSCCYAHRKDWSLVQWKKPLINGKNIHPLSRGTLRQKTQKSRAGSAGKDALKIGHPKVLFLAIKWPAFVCPVTTGLYTILYVF